MNLNKKNDIESHKRIKNEIINKCSNQKEKWTIEITKEIEDDKRKGRQDKVYYKVKRLLPKLKMRSTRVKYKKDKILINNDEICDKWKEYID